MGGKNINEFYMNININKKNRILYDFQNTKESE